MQPYNVFDLDGCLVDTREAVETAYRMAGVEMPVGAWGKPWREWCSPHVHELKNHFYPSCLVYYLQPGPALPLWKRLTGNRVILTGASLEALEAVSVELPVLRLASYAVVECTRQRKHEELLKLTGGGTYYDDDAVAGLEIVEGTAFRLVQV